MTTTATQDAPLSQRGLPSDRGRLLAAVAFLLALAAILGAWGSEIFGGLVPCELCLEQRWAYYAGLPVLAVVLLAWNRLPRAGRLAGLGIAALIFAWGTYMGTYHAGVEWGFWPGPTACTGLGTDISFGDLQNINSVRIVPCDKVQFRFLGISLAGYNALVSLAVVALLGVSAAITGRTASR